MTGRATGFLIAAFMLYLFGNQTQIGWLYVMSALIGGLLLVGFVLSRSSLSKINAQRSLHDDEYYEGASITLDLGFMRRARLPAYQIQVTETCPLAAPEQREHRLYLPIVPTRQPLVYQYEVLLDRRGVYQFPPMEFKTGFPFGFFRRARTLELPTQALVYPEMRSIRRFPLFERQLAAQQISTRAGHGGEVIGVRPFRSGDSPRHVHWRSTARVGQLMSKEFADEQQPTLTLLLDTQFDGDLSSKHNGFEWAIKCMVSIADYAKNRSIPFSLVHGDPNTLQTDQLLAWDAFLQIAARVQTAPTSLTDLLSRVSHTSLIVTLIAQPREAIIAPLLELSARGTSLTTLLIDDASFGAQDSQASAVYDALRAAAQSVLLIGYPDDYTAQLSAPLMIQGLRDETVQTPSAER